MKIALLGCGTVGSATCEILKKSSFEVVRYLVKNKRDDSLSTTNFNDILNDDTIETVIEVMGGIHPAYEYICACLNAHKNVITANKAVVAKYFDEFMNLANKNNVYFRIEACVAGGIPWIHEILRISSFDQIHSFSGIFNGTTNYILDCMNRYDTSFEVALTNAQEKGYAESNPSADIEGFDVQNKAAISAMLAYQGKIDVDNIDCYGMSSIQSNDISYFKSKNVTCKYLAHSKKYRNSISLFVIPTLCKSIESFIDSNLNIVTYESQYLGKFQMIGQGAGGYPTASAIVSDCMAIQNKQKMNLVLQEYLHIDNTQECYHYYVRSTQLNEDIALSYEKDEHYFYIKTKKMSIHEIFEFIQTQNKNDIFVALWEN